MSDQPTFHESFAPLLLGLPPSQLREAYKRLSTAKQPLSDEEIASEHPRVQECLAKISAAYQRKKSRSAVASKARREATRSVKEPKPVEAQEEPVEAMLEACSIECVVSEAEHEEPEPIPQEITASAVEDHTLPPTQNRTIQPSSPVKPPRRRLVRAPPTAASAPPKKPAGNSLVSIRS